IENKEYQEEIFAVNFYKKVDEIKESVALETDLKTWANASAWSLEDDSSVEITEVTYDFDAENIVAGEYLVTFKTEGYEYKIDTTDEYEEGAEVGLMFNPEDIHIMEKQGG
ncbi:MAG: ABC transporter ATP-binding protein, partial [Anaerotignaceae bacterium]